MNIVITGSTKGLGKALAIEFLKQGDNVVISSRTKERVDSVVEELQKKFMDRKIIGFKVDVGNPDEIAALAKYALDQLSSIDIWINNAGSVPKRKTDFIDLSTDDIKSVLNANVYGTIWGTREALRIMVKQGYGHIFNMEGMGSRGRSAPKNSIYGYSKNPIPYLTKTLQTEIKGTGVGVHNLSPGMMTTDLLLNELEPDHRNIINILADPPDIIAKFLVEKARNVTGSGKNISYLTLPKIIWRFVTSFRRKNRLIDE
jgi:chlorophyll(ide) b reductase